MYTERFTEGMELLGTIDPASHSTEQNTGYLNTANYARVVIIIHCATTQTIDVDLEQGTTDGGAGAKPVASNSLDATVASDETMVVIECRMEELDVDGGFSFLNVEATPSGAKVFGVQVWGEPSYKPAVTTSIDQIIAN